jgi:hypothetical protein
LSSCTKDSTSRIHKGTYNGTFQRSNSSQIANVTIVFDENTFRGQSNLTRYPAMCHGAFYSLVDKIIFQDECVWTADFDGTFILNGEFIITLRSDTLELSKNYAGLGFRDIYKLKRQ